MISHKLAVEILNIALSSGADFAEIYHEEKKSQSISIENGRIENIGHSNTVGVGLRILKNNGCYFGSLDGENKKDLIKLASSLAATLKGERVLEVKSFKNVHYKKRLLTDEPIYDVDIDKKINLVKEGVEAIMNYDSRLVRTIGSFSSSKKKVTIFNSREQKINRDEQRGSLTFMSIASDGKSFEQAFVSRNTQENYSFYEKLDVKKLAIDNVAKIAIQNLLAKECPAGRMPVVIGNGWGGVLFHEACGHALESTSVAKKQSVFADKKGQQIASSIVTAYDDGTIPGVWGSIDIDDDGHPGQKKELIKNGILNEYMIDDYNGRRMNEIGNGSTRRENYRYAPTSRMTNTYIANGESTPEEIIKATKLGLYTVGFLGGQVNPQTGEFNFGCSEAYIIRDGKICEPVKGASLIGTCQEIMQNIDMVGNDLDLGAGMCGSQSGSVPVCVGQPTLRIKEITVGGRGGKLE